MKRRNAQQIMFDVLESLEWGMKYFDGYTPRAGTEKKYILEAVDFGYAESIGFVHQADGDGRILENRTMREAWRLTDKGIFYLKKLREGLGIDGYPCRIAIRGER